MSPRPLEKHPHLLPWYAARTLQAEAAEEVKRHVAGCPECRHVVEQMSAMAGSLSADASPVHVHPSDLIRYETDGFEGALEVGQEVEAHLIRCAACRQDLARLRLHRREEDAREGKPPVMNSTASTAGRRRAKGWLRWPAIAAVAASVLVVVAFVTQNREPPPVSGELVFTPRSRATTTRPALHSPGPWSVRVVLPYAASRGTYRVRIENESGDILYAIDGPFTATADGVLVLPIPDLGKPDTYNLIVEPLGAPASSVSYWFSILPALETG